MALDEVLIDSVASKSSLPVLRFYAWDPPAVSIGYFQKLDKSIDVEFCRNNKIDIVRRITGGRTVFHNKELTYSVVIPMENDIAKGSVTDVYKKISMGLLEGLKICGIMAEFSPGIAHNSTTSACFEVSSRYEIVISGKKLVGSAQTRKKGVVLQHGSIILNLEEELFAQILGLKGKQKEEFLIEYPKKATDIVRNNSSKIERELLVKKIKEGFCKSLNIDFEEDKINLNEEKAVTILKEKYKKSN
jgi:lipoate-protein ligase A